jgi:cystathionine beta-lyase
MHLLNPGDRVVLIADVYGGVYRMTSQVYEPKGYRFDYLPAEEFPNLAAHLDDSTRMVWIETPSNPMLNLVDIRAAARRRTRPARCLVVDNTFATPYLQRRSSSAPTSSSTRRRSTSAGTPTSSAASRRRTTPRSREAPFLQKSLGAVPGPFDSWLVLRGIKTLAVRMRPALRERDRRSPRCSSSTPRVERVLYPACRTIPATRSRRGQMRNFGGMVSFLAESPRRRRQSPARTRSSSSRSRSAASRA